MLCAWVVSRSDEGLGYTTGIAKIAAMFLINMPTQQGFVVMRNLLERHCMRSFYGGISTRDEVGYYINFHHQDSADWIDCRLRLTTGEIWVVLVQLASYSFLFRIFDTMLADGMPKSIFPLLSS